ncbi:MAG: hypothetical protein ABUK01_07910 [Leptospirales bacterium]
MDSTYPIRDVVTEFLEPGFGLYLLEVVSGNKECKVRVLLDKLDNPYGTPAIDDCVRYAKVLRTRLSEMAEKGLIPEDFSLEVSSPGAERELKTVQDWKRFQKLPMKVLYKDTAGTSMSLVMKFSQEKENSSEWTIENAQFNVNQGRYKKKMKKEDLLIIIPEGSVQCVNLYLGDTTG